MLRNLTVLGGLLLFGIIYLASSGVAPEDANIPFQVGLTLVTGGVFVFFQKLLEANPNKEILVELRDTKQKLMELSATVKRLQQALSDESK